MPLFVTTLAVLCAAALAVPRASERAQQEGAAKTYAGKCAMCHGVAGAGDGVAAAALTPKPTNFTSAEFQASRTDEQLAAAIKDGKGAMPAYGSQLSGEAIKGLVAYLRSFGPKSP